MKEEYKNKILALTEVLESMPVNNAKNIKDYLDKIKEISLSTTKDKDLVYEEIIKRYNNITNKKVNPYIKEKEEVITSLTYALNMLDSNKTSYEKLKLDCNFYNLEHFYKDDLENTNDTIILIIKAFEIVGIPLTNKDFYYSNYAKTYMENFFKTKDYKVDKDEMKSIFESLYWKCPNIINHIELNLKSLYQKYSKYFDNYISIKKIEILRKYNMDEKTLKINLDKLVKEKDDLKRIDDRLLLDKFISKNLDIKLYDEVKVLDGYKKYVDEDLTTIEDYSKYNKDLTNMYYSLIEYDNYNKYIFIVDLVKDIYKEKDKYKNLTKKDLKIINKEEQKLKKLNNKLTKLLLKSSQKVEEVELLINNKIIELDKLYEEYESNLFNESVSLTLIDSSSIYDLLKLVLNNYKYLTSCIKKNFSDITDIEVLNKIDDLEKFLCSSYNTLIDNISITSNDVNTERIIADHYQLLNLKIKEDDINSDNTLNLINNINTILVYNDILKSNITTFDISFVIDVDSKIKK